MKAVREVGFKKTFKFLFFVIAQVIYHQWIAHLFYIPQARKLFLIVLGARIGTATIIMDVTLFNLHHKGPKGLKIGDECFLGDQVLLDLYDEIVLENQVTLAQRVTVLTHTNVGYKDHPLQKYFPKSSKPVTFKKGSVIGAGSIILPGITVGEESFVAAGSVVTQNVPKRTLVAGAPAKVVRKIS